ncbi:hypothetical protein [Psychrobacter sp. P11G5]|uniref:hypothetical protein n=1 Tax=Psychrobacter sp. P11G5 TaxID=1699624 RepID=UPI00078D9F5F|nr:hypothetical protein [Psychrobacter sp. P11G5]AMN67379.1 hypothetical protein AK825_06350 [Psychrobacter sp. P11G5]
MTGRFISVFNIVKPYSIWKKHVLAVVVITTTPLIAQANPTGFGTFTRDTNTIAGSIASGTYRTAANATGKFKVTAGPSNGYNGSSVTVGGNGVEIKSDANTTTDKDKFTYTITITPDDITSLHTIKIGQTSYTTGGNSEIARQTLSFTRNTQINLPVQATVRENPDVGYFFGAMGDYFMGKKLAGNSFSSNNTLSRPQLRFDSSNGGDSGLYYYGITALNGSGNSSSFTPTTNANGQVSFASGQKRGTLPPTPTFTNILKETSTNPNNQNTYASLNTSTVIPNNGSYVSYGVENSKSNYVIAVRNAESVTLTYEGIMRGNSALEADVVGETYNEWISFGVESEPLYTFSGTVFNDNGGIDDNNANASTIGGMYNNADYFNGIFNTTEKGITGSTIRLVNDCANPTIEYASQTLTSTDANQIGKYQFNILASTIGNRSSVCIIETRPNTSYPIRTSSEKKTVSLAASTYNYPSNDFGRVIDQNVALVLTKYQHVNNCPPTLDYTNISNTPADDPNSGFSTKSIDNIEPGKCIAYKITATNRANLSINNFVLQDVLQEKNVNNAIVTSKLANPSYQASDYATDSVAIGDNGTVKTISLILDPRTERSFYFNTKYGTTQSDTANTP